MQKYNMGVWGKTQDSLADFLYTRNLDFQEQTRCTNIITKTADKDNVYRSSTRGFCVDALAVRSIFYFGSEA